MTGTRTNVRLASLFSLDCSQHRRRHRIDCSRCATADTISTGGSGANLPNEVIRRKFVERGWHVSHRIDKHLCPDCFAKSRKKPVDGQGAVFAASQPGPLENPPAALPEPAATPSKEIPMSEPVKLAAVPPREPTREDRRRIVDELSAHWDAKHERYCGAMSDSHLAEALKVPRKWVTDIRVEFFGDDDRNEATAMRINRAKVDLERLIPALERQMGAMMEMAENAEKLVVEAKAALAAMK